MMLVAILTVRPEALDTFRSYEHQAARIMARHGGAIERVVVIPGEKPGVPLKEVHLVRFPSAGAFAAYRADPALAALVSLRNASVLSTELLFGEEGPRYGE
jgi:uncharacterized protein (DUF1330 family)